MPAAALDYFVHPSSYVDEGAVIGEGTKIWHFCHVMSDARIGRSCVLGQGVNVGSRAVLGDNVKVQNHVSIFDDVILEDDVFCGPSMVFTNVRTPRAYVSRKDAYERTIVQRGATLGANCTIVCGVTIGRYAFIGADAVVTRDVPSYALMLGNPARQRGWMCHCGERLSLSSAHAAGLADEQARCGACRSEYRLDAGRLLPQGER